MGQKVGPGTTSDADMSAMDQGPILHQMTRNPTVTRSHICGFSPAG
jgi:hypothetical protein